MVTTARGLSRGLFAGTVLALFGVVLLVRADEEAACANGRRVRGTLTVAEGGALRFVPAGQEKPLAAETVEGVRFDPTGTVTPRAGNSLRMLLPDGQQVTGELLKLDGERVRLRPAWSERVDLKRDAMIALTQPPGYRTLFADDLTNATKAWKTDGDALTYELSAPLEAGRVGVTFQEKDKSGRCQFEAVFQTEAGARTLKVTVTSPGENYQVEASGLKGEAREVRRTAGPHQFAVQFTKHSLRVTCDDDVLWYNVEQGPGGTLKQVRLTGAGGVWSAFYLAKAVDEPRRPPGDPEQDEVWLASDDQLFGKIDSADARAIEIDGRFGKRSLPWSEVRGIYFRRPKATESKAEPNTVRVWLRTGFGNESDILAGVLLKIDEREFTLKHAEIGELRLDRKWLREVRPRVDTK
jgi:hypothetical protein